MANSTIRIVFSDLAEPETTGMAIDGQVMSFTFFNNTSINVQETFVPLRVIPYQSTIGAPPSYTTGNDEKPAALRDAILLDYPSLFTAVVESNDTVLVTALDSDAVFTAGTDTAYLSYVVDNVVAPVGDITVTGLEEDLYLINNEIHLNITSIGVPIYFKTVLTNLKNQKVSTSLITYPNSEFSAELNIQSIIKSLFEYPADAFGYTIPDNIVYNANRYKIQIYYNTTTAIINEVLGFETIKTFIRGGKRTTQTNQTIGVSILTPCEKLPVWIGYDTAEYYISGSTIRKRLLMDVPADRIQIMRSKGCNEVYFKFLNQGGGYSNWLFESHAINESNTNQGDFVRNNEIDDLGNEVDYKLQVSGKVSKEFIQLMADLIISEEIYAIVDGQVFRVISMRNSLQRDKIKRAYPVSYNFNVPIRFNPSLLWSN